MREVIRLAELTVRAFFHIGDMVIPIEDMSPELLEETKNKMIENLSRGMSEYYSTHLDEYVKLAGVDSADM